MITALVVGAILGWIVFVALTLLFLAGASTDDH